MLEEIILSSNFGLDDRRHGGVEGCEKTHKLWTKDLHICPCQLLGMCQSRRRESDGEPNQYKYK